MREVRPPGDSRAGNGSAQAPGLSKAESRETHTHTHWGAGTSLPQQNSVAAECQRQEAPTPCRSQVSTCRRYSGSSIGRAQCGAGESRDSVLPSTGRQWESGTSPGRSYKEPLVPSWGRGSHQLLQERVSEAGRRGCQEGFWHREPDRSPVQSTSQPGQKSTQCDRVRRCWSPGS